MCGILRPKSSKFLSTNKLTYKRVLQEMTNKYVCCVCERVIKANQHAVECSRCCTWIHKGCSGLSEADFDKFHTIAKRSGSHDWICTRCSKSEVKRISFGIVSDSAPAARSDGLPNRSTRAGSTSGDSDALQTAKPINPSSETVATAEGEVKNLISTLLKKTNTNNKDIVNLFSKMFSLLIGQRNELQNILVEMKSSQCERIDRLQQEVDELKNKVKSFQATPNILNHEIQGENIVDSTLFDEMQDRTSRANNVILYNLKESSSDETAARIAHDKIQVRDILQQLTVEGGDYRVVRMGKLANQNKPRPVKVIFSNSNVVHNCLKNKKKLAGNIYLNADLTPMQRKQFQQCRMELQARKANGEDDLIIRYIKGAPKLLKASKQPKN